jgi:uncharacterized membrane protein YidH (DUF202 family)
LFPSSGIDDDGPVERLGILVVAVTCVTGLVLAGQVDDALRATADGRPAVATLLGWLPVGGLATWVAALLAGRALRTTRGRTGSAALDRLLVGVALVWLGATLSLLPVSKGVGRDRDLSRAGPDVVEALRGSVIGLAGVLLLALAIAAWRFRGYDTDRRPPLVQQQWWAAASLAPPMLVVLVVVLLT